MNITRVLGLTACVLLLCSVAGAEIELVDQSLDYTYSDYFFSHAPELIDDHQPHYRGSWEDWGWTHDFSELVPQDATGIAWAQVAISAWDVDAIPLVEGEIPEVDVIYANGVEIGRLGDTAGRNWETFWFVLPASVVDELWQDGEVFISIDIDAENGGHRMALDESTLTVAYIVPEPATIALLGLGGLVMLRRRRS